MKLLYTILFTVGMLVTGYLFVNDFTFTHVTFSNYLITTLFIALLALIALGGVLYAVSIKRKHSYKDVMTIRQYYQYKS